MRPASSLWIEPDSHLPSPDSEICLPCSSRSSVLTARFATPQLLYTTHSPFLINRNFPRRIRLVRKGDAEEGTQYVSAGHVRRYEPIRSALGIDCAQTLFMGATNVIVEGATDQYLVSELVRFFATHDNISELLDLNSVVLTSADGAGGPVQLLSASNWGDEPRPATVVVLDDDAAGHRVRDRITGVERGAKQLISPEFVVTMSDVLSLSPEAGHTAVTIEDVVPVKMYAEALRRYFKRWYDSDLGQESEDSLADGTFAEHGLVDGALKVFNRILGQERDTYDKMGVLREALPLLEDFADSRRRRKSSCQVRRPVRLPSRESSCERACPTDSLGETSDQSHHQGVLRYP